MEVFEKETEIVLYLTAVKNYSFSEYQVLIGQALLPELILYVKKVTSLEVKVCCDSQLEILHTELS